jgi:hypothetical protein
MMVSCSNLRTYSISPAIARPNVRLGDSGMHILAIVVGIIAAAGVWYWRVKAAKEVVDDVGSVVGRVQGRIRMNNFRKKAEGSALASIEDPALAAAVFLHALANEKRDALHLAEPRIREEISRIVADADLDEVVSYAQWAARDVADARDVVRRFKPLWRQKLTREERADLVAMAETIASLGEAGDHNQKLTLVTLRTALGPEQNR